MLEDHFLTEQPGLVIDGELKREISVAALQAALRDHPEHFSDNARSKAVHAVKAIETGTLRVHIVDGRVFDGLLNEIFSNEGVGSLIYGNDYQQIRQATRRDVRFIYNLTRGAVRREELLHRTQQAIEKTSTSSSYSRSTRTSSHASPLLYPDKPQLAEVGSLCVMPFTRAAASGKRWSSTPACRPRSAAPRRVALSTQSFGFFINSCGFQEQDKSVLPRRASSFTMRAGAMRRCSSSRSPDGARRGRISAPPATPASGPRRPGSGGPLRRNPFKNRPGYRR